MKYVIIGQLVVEPVRSPLKKNGQQAEIVMFERGAYVSYTNCGLPYYIGNVIKDQKQLFVQTAASF